MSEKTQVRICEGLGVRFPWATRPLTFQSGSSIQNSDVLIYFDLYPLLRSAMSYTQCNFSIEVVIWTGNGS